MIKIAQMFTGAFSSPVPVSEAELVQKTSAAFDILGCSALIAGWNTDPSAYRGPIAEARRRGKKIYLWLPVFSEECLGYPSVPAVDLRGQNQGGLSPAGGESFAFFCPSHPNSLQRIRDLFSAYFLPLGFDGVFLDKIRGASFANGFEAALGCLCPLCREYYQKHGADPSLKKERAAFLPSARRGAEYCFRDDQISQFFRVKALRITKSVGELCDWFHAQGLEVGLDVYAPMYAYYTGQDIKALSSKADFIKPMMYRITEAPAGIPFERRHFKNILGDERSALEAAWGVDSPESFEGLKVQMESLSGAACPVYAGFEVNCVANICLSGLPYMARTLKELSVLKADGLVFSWDILSADLKILRLALEEACCG